jgi:hypothetical protein
MLRLLGLICLFVLWCDSPQWAEASSSTRFLDHTQRRVTVGRTPLDEWSVRRRNLYLTTNNTHKKSDKKLFWTWVYQGRSVWIYKYKALLFLLESLCICQILPTKCGEFLNCVKINEDFFFSKTHRLIQEEIIFGRYNIYRCEKNSFGHGSTTGDHSESTNIHHCYFLLNHSVYVKFNKEFCFTKLRNTEK